MRLSTLQRHIVRESYLAQKRRVPRKVFTKFYKTTKTSGSIIDAITKSLERLIEKGLLIGYGRRTPQKWYIDEVALTPLGRKTGRRLLGQQQSLPFKQ